MSFQFINNRNQCWICFHNWPLSGLKDKCREVSNTGTDIHVAFLKAGRQTKQLHLLHTKYNVMYR